MSNDTIHGKLNNNLNIVKYTGKETDTAKVTVDNTERTISVDVKDGGGSSSTSDNIRIKSVKILEIPEPILTITSYPISDNIINLIKNTDRVRLILNGLRTRKVKGGRKRPRHGRYYIRQNIDDLNETELNNFFKFKAPQITEKMLKTDKEGNTYICYTQKLQDNLTDKIKAVHGEQTSIPTFNTLKKKIRTTPLSSAAYVGWPLKAMLTWWDSKPGPKPRNLSKDMYISYNNGIGQEKNSYIYSLGASGFDTELIAGSYDREGCQVFNWRPQVLYLGFPFSTAQQWINLMKKTDFIVNNRGISLFSYPVVGRGARDGQTCIARVHFRRAASDLKDNGTDTLIDSKQDLKDYSRHNRTDVCENTVFSFGILQEDIQKNNTHIFKKTYEKYPAVLRIWYRENFSFDKDTLEITNRNFNANYSLKNLPAHSNSWK